MTRGVGRSFAPLIALVVLGSGFASARGRPFAERGGASAVVAAHRDVPTFVAPGPAFDARVARGKTVACVTDDGADPLQRAIANELQHVLERHAVHVVRIDLKGDASRRLVDAARTIKKNRTALIVSLRSNPVHNEFLGATRLEGQHTGFLQFWTVSDRGALTTLSRLQGGFDLLGLGKAIALDREARAPAAPIAGEIPVTAMITLGEALTDAAVRGATRLNPSGVQIVGFPATPSAMRELARGTHVAALVGFSSRAFAYAMADQALRTLALVRGRLRARIRAAMVGTEAGTDRAAQAAGAADHRRGGRSLRSAHAASEFAPVPGKLCGGAKRRRLLATRDDVPALRVPRGHLRLQPAAHLQRRRATTRSPLGICLAVRAAPAADPLRRMPGRAAPDGHHLSRQAFLRLRTLRRRRDLLRSGTLAGREGDSTSTVILRWTPLPEGPHPQRLLQELGWADALSDAESYPIFK